MTATSGTPDVPVFFATTEGQTRKIADRLAAVLRDEGFDSRAVDLSGPDAVHVDWSQVRGAFVGGSLHAGAHQVPLTRFLTASVAQLNARPTVFYSVSLSAASKNAAERDAVQKIAETFASTLGWTPQRIVCIAGRLAYSQYGFLKRMLLKRIARKEGAPTDTSRDYEFTDWTLVEGLARELASQLRGAAVERRGGVPAA